MKVDPVCVRLPRYYSAAVSKYLLPRPNFIRDFDIYSGHGLTSFTAKYLHNYFVAKNTISDGLDLCS